MAVQRSTVTNTRKPKWSKWRFILEVKLWEAIALSLNIDPDKVKFNHDNWALGNSVFEESKEFEDRLEILKRTIDRNNGLKSLDISIGNQSANTISLPQFAVWALSIGWKIPQELADLTQEQKTESENSNVDNVANSAAQAIRKRRSLSRMTVGLQVSIAAIDVLEEEKGKTPTPEQVYEYLLSKRDTTDLVYDFGHENEKVMLTNGKNITIVSLRKQFKTTIFFDY